MVELGREYIRGNARQSVVNARQRKAWLTVFERAASAPGTHGVGDDSDKHEKRWMAGGLEAK
jgi:hypothetical protein